MAATIGLKGGSGTSAAIQVNGADRLTIDTSGNITSTGTISAPSVSTTSIQATEFAEVLNTTTGSTTISLANGSIHKVITSGNNTITLPNSQVGKSYVVIIQYTGVHTITWAGGSTIKWAFGTQPIQTKVNGKFDVLTFFCDGTNTYASAFGTGF